MSENSSAEVSPVMNPPETNENEGPENRALPQEKVNEQIKGFIATLTI